MLPRPLPEPFDSDEHLFEPWWGGERALVSIGPADAAGNGEVADPRCGRARPHGRAPRAGRAGRPGRGALGDPRRRAGRRRRRRPGRCAPSWRDGWRGEPGRPAAFLAFDLLHLDGRSLLSQPLVRRREALRRVLRPGDEVVAVPAIATEGIALFEAAVAQGIAGILARQRSSPYLPGRPQPAVALRRGDARRPVPRRSAEVPLRGARACGRAGPGPDQPAAARGPVGARRRQALPRGRHERAQTRAAARTAARPPHTSGSPRPRRPRWPPRAARSRAATCHGSTAETIIRASITNGLNGGRNDAIVTHAPPPPPSATIAVR